MGKKFIFHHSNGLTKGNIKRIVSYFVEYSVGNLKKLKYVTYIVTTLNLFYLIDELIILD